MDYAVCTVSAAPLRKEPSHRSEMTSQLLFGETVLILQAREEWLRIKCIYDNYEGWITHHLMAAIDERIAIAPTNFVTTGLINEIKLQHNVFQIPMGCSLAGYSENTHRLWNEDYVYEGACRNVKLQYTDELFQNTIRPWLNAPYLWGGKTFMGVDCSGFVQTVFKVLGVPLLRDAYQQAEQGTAVTDVENAHEGNVAFFKNESGKITHVGIILAGNKIIHASGKVRIDTLTTEGIFTSDTNKQTHQFHSIKRIANFTD